MRERVREGYGKRHLQEPEPPRKEGAEYVVGREKDEREAIGGQASIEPLAEKKSGCRRASDPPYEIVKGWVLSCFT